MTISVIVPVKNDARRLSSCLAQISANVQPAALEVLVADNGSNDGSDEVARRAGARVLSLPAENVSGLRNIAAREARGDLLAFIDADNQVAPGWTTAAAEVFSDQAVAAAGAVYTAPPKGTWVQRTYGSLRGRTVGRHEARWLAAGNLVVRRSVFLNLGGFDTSLEACEDVDFCQRLRRAGWRLTADERMQSIHLGDPPTLAALFRGERWRGRGNMRVTLRGPVAAADLVSLATPVLTLVALIALAGSLILAPFDGRAVSIAIGAVVALAGLAGAKALKASINAGVSGPRAFGQAMIVALVYNIARALALVTRAGHHRR